MITIYNIGLFPLVSNNCIIYKHFIRYSTFLFFLFLFECKFVVKIIIVGVSFCSQIVVGWL